MESLSLKKPVWGVESNWYQRVGSYTLIERQRDVKSVMEASGACEYFHVGGGSKSCFNAKELQIALNNVTLGGIGITLLALVSYALKPLPCRLLALIGGVGLGGLNITPGVCVLRLHQREKQHFKID